MTVVSPMPELTDLILEVGGESLLQCMQCGTCTTVCPWPRFKEQFSPRQVIRCMAFGLEGYEEEDLWNCVSCNSCVIRCPRGIDIIDVMQAGRAVMLEAGAGPRSFSGPLTSLRTEGNPWSGNRQERHEWAQEHPLPTYDASKEYLFFSCCTQSYDPRNTKVAKAMVRVFEAAELSFGIIGKEESCCGDQARKVGAQEVFEKLESQNLELFEKHDVDKIIVASPHCLQTFTRDETARKKLQIKHYACLFEELSNQGKLVFSSPINAKVTYHDPCYLGRHAGEYEAPRRLLRAIPELCLVEMPRNRQNSLCCGGGGGGLWLDMPTEERLAVHRVREALDVGAEIIATACPYCTSMLEDAIKNLDVEDSIRVFDVAELVASALSTEGGL